jgi:hypothetical protein
LWSKSSPASSQQTPKHPACILAFDENDDKKSIIAATETLKNSLVVFGCSLATAGRGNDDMSITRQESFEDFDANASGTFADARGK